MTTEIGERLTRQGLLLDLHGACSRPPELVQVDLANARFAGADAENASLRGSNAKAAALRARRQPQPSPTSTREA